ncbi:single-stranded DNA-binding protein [bacterium]|nr:single-stranded DNA-binding protein [bacterium]
MSFYLNKILLGGNLTADPEVKTLNNDVKVCNFTIAINRVWFGSYGDPTTKKEEVAFIRITAWNRWAEKMLDVKKGANIFVEGRLTQNKYTTADGSQRSYLDVVADRLSFITKHGRSLDEASNFGNDDYHKSETQQETNIPKTEETKPETSDNDKEDTTDLWNNETDQ